MRFIPPATQWLSIVLCCYAPIALAQGVDGFAEPYREIEVAAAEMGTLSAVKTKEGDKVVAGQLLASLDDTVLVASLRTAEEAMNAEGRLRSATAELNLQQERFAKISGLRTRRHASQVELDRAAAQLEISRAQFQAVKEELTIKALDYKRIKAQLEQRRIKSPIDGIVTLVTKDVGEFVSPSDPVVAKVVQLDPLLVVFSVPKEEARKLRKEQRVPVRFNYDTTNIEAIVEFVSPTADAQSGTTRVKVRVPNPDLKLQSGDACRLVGIDAIGSDGDVFTVAPSLQTKPASVGPTVVQP